MVKYKCKKEQEVHIKMSNIRYGKPNMNNLPRDLWISIINDMENSKPVDREAIKKEVAETKERIYAERQKRLNGN